MNAQRNHGEGDTGTGGGGDAGGGIHPPAADPYGWLDRFDDRQLAALQRVAKTRAYAFFRDPRAMIALRERTTR